MVDREHGDARPGRPVLWGAGAALLVCALLHVALYGPTIAQATFLGDDWFHIEKIPKDRIPHLFFGDWHLGRRDEPGAFYRPLPRVLMQAGREWFDLWTPGYLILPALFHVLNCALIWALAYGLTERRVPAWTAALAFAAYPTHLEPMLQISTLADSMATCGLLLAFAGNLALRASRRLPGGVAIVAGLLLAAMSKESWVTLPLLVAWCEWVWRANPKRLLPDRSALIRIALFVAFGLAYIGFRQIALGSTGGYSIPMTLNAVRLTFDGTFQLILFPFAPLTSMNELINIVTLLGALIAVWALLGFPRLLLFGMGWMLIATIPFVRLVPGIDSGRLVYVVVVGWALFLGGTLDALAARGKTPALRGAVTAVSGLALAAALVATQQVYSEDWGRSFSMNRRLVDEMAETVRANPEEPRFAVLNWPTRIGAAASNRADSAARGIATVATTDQRRVEPQLAADASTGTITFAVTADIRTSVGRVEAVELWTWSGEQLAEWEPLYGARLEHARLSGALDFRFEKESDSLRSPALDGGAGYYSVQASFRKPDNGPTRVLWWGPELPFNPRRSIPFFPMLRGKETVWVANPGSASGLDGILFMPIVRRQTVTIHSIAIARFQIAPLVESSGR